MVAKRFGLYFEKAIGLDPSECMVSTAREFVGSRTPPVRFGVSSAEELDRDLDPSVVDCSIDLLTAANAAHWFDLPPLVW